MLHGTLKNYQINRCRCELCREANREYQREYRKANPEKIRGYHKKSYVKNKDSIAHYKREYRARPLVKAHRKTYRNDWRAKTYPLARAEALYALGNKCIMCGLEDQRILQIDHINGDGKADRQRHHNTQLSMYKAICKNGDMGIYQLLCANCHVIKHYEKRQEMK